MDVQNSESEEEKVMGEGMSELNNVQQTYRLAYE